MTTIAARPFDFPHDGPIGVEDTALVIIDMQRDFCDPLGYVARKGYDLSSIQAAIAPIRRLLDLARRKQLTVVHTREGYAPDLSDIPPYKLWRSRQLGDGIGGEGPLGRLLIRDEPGWEIIPELAPQDGEIVIDKPGTGSFFCSNLQANLCAAGVRNLIVTGVTTEVCVHTTVREAVDRGFNCLTVEDACGAVTLEKHRQAIEMLTTESGIFGCVANEKPVATALLKL